MKRLFIAILSFISSFAFANVPISSCTQYLNYSDNAFYAAVSANSATAASIAQTLEACVSANACYQINGVDTCANLLTSRLFLSEYFAYNNNSGSTHWNAAPEKATTVTNNQPINNDNVEQQHPPQTVSKSTVIHWF